MQAPTRTVAGNSDGDNESFIKLDQLDIWSGGTLTDKICLSMHTLTIELGTRPRMFVLDKRECGFIVSQVLVMVFVLHHFSTYVQMGYMFVLAIVSYSAFR